MANYGDLHSEVTNCWSTFFAPGVRPKIFETCFALKCTELQTIASFSHIHQQAPIRNYSMQHSPSERTSYASESSLNLLVASSELSGFLSGCHFSANFRYLKKEDIHEIPITVLVRTKASCNSESFISSQRYRTRKEMTGNSNNSSAN
jgi:hypothetical protein